MADIINWVLELNEKSQPAWSLAGNLAFAVSIISNLYFISRDVFRSKFNRIATETRKGLELRSNIESDLNEYVFGLTKNAPIDIDIRFVFWKHYKNIPNDDGFKHSVYVKYYTGVTNVNPKEGTTPFGGSWMSNIGVLFQMHLWCTSTSCYIDKRGVFFFDDEGKTFPGFSEFRDGRLKVCLPYRNIAAFDFKEFLDNEPVFYIRYKYTDYRKLYAPDVALLGKDDYDHRLIYLDYRRCLRKYSRFGWVLMAVKCGLFLR